ncbi:MAG: hypothetical protein UV63_C0016G0004 [Microgenomates group bacterium GW2011_GWC1_43_11]|uniref:Nucleotidyl transferase AbiEii/AbiGii toxin family protein n=2 Tax=Candidatus Gottesmaniibacteriota TaxID=1752720 RepID=A0A0G1IQR6_9BACT|nr:MAG: hypothetical protein UV63_C0016G0004 [Microgenomates group bacterium GW2011_GWC1_43_11]KKT37536.1 MAG: hypothetical protein UW22_C0024G0003 [Candidatus Gottesmanbacteria bacterium GW2011_GWB1_44_11c]KKT61308.1 MAG: hypothetical protein UW52_C0006G0029 [Candidatus Gottesmanbacteria bacterium GW2011_GWA1_44_24b]HCM82548.1 hypothetical protein [Patescibacteria group bacterium]
MLKIYLDILDEGRKAIFEKLSIFSQYGYLAGGTALALQIGHRQSVDFDVFTYKPFTKSLLSRIKSELHPKEVILNQQDQYSFSVGNGIEMTFIWFEQKLLDSAIPTSSLPLASIRDIAANKAHTVGRRALWRDYVDIFWILKYKYLTLSDIIDSAKRKYGIEFVETQFLEQLGYFSDVSVVPIQYIRVTHEPEEIKHYLLSQVQTYMQAKFDKA